MPQERTSNGANPVNYNTKAGVDTAGVAKARLIGMLSATYPGSVVALEKAVNLLIDEIVQAAVAEARSDVRESMRSHLSCHHGSES
jgi:hypothetical protein